MGKNIVVGQSGGPTAVINSSVAGVYAQAKKLAKMFQDNFTKKYPNMPKNIAEAGPKAD